MNALEVTVHGAVAPSCPGASLISTHDWLPGCSTCLKKLKELAANSHEILEHYV